MICYLYVSPSSSSNWGADILPHCLSTGDSIYVTMNGYGNESLFDVRVENEYGNGEEFYQFNLLTVSNITILGNGQASYY